MSKRSPALLIEDILEATRKIQDYTKDHTFESFSNDSKTIDAVIRNFEIIGEATNRLPIDFRDKYEKKIEWYRIIGFRNRIVHDYMGVDLSIVWNILKNFLPKLDADLSSILDIL
ncbi:MAG: HepT-like ribonuclease domain-containing protein [Bacteroidota bacterium]